MSYNHQTTDAKWQAAWEKAQIFRAQDESPKDKYYVLVEFPYPSGAGLHVGHPRSYTALDIVARQQRMMGKNVLFPMGWDAFGLPAENYAIKTGIHPSVITKQNIDTFRRQLKAIGFSFDWSREINTTDPAYYKWTQWMFLQFFKAGLAYKSTMAINWCPKDKIGLANEEVIGGKCERCGTAVEKRDKEQWMIAITKYADRLIDDLDTVDYLPKIKKQQIDWIGRSEGAEIDFAVVDSQEKITVFTTRPDTINGVTYLVIAPEHPLVESLTTDSERDTVHSYTESVAAKTDMERGDETKPKTGAFTGSFVINPANGEQVPVWIADYVLGHYGTGAVMAVPQHDERDLAFAQTFALPVLDHPLLTFDDALAKTAGKKTIQYKLRDWVFSRQRYWGEPIPLIHCDHCATKKQKVLLIHGFTGRSDKNWLPWAKAELEAQGFEVFAPTMTTTDHPVLESWLSELQPYVDQLGPDDIMVGHSLGGKTALKILEQTKHKIGHTILVAPVVGATPTTTAELIAKEALNPGKDYPSTKDFWNAPLDWQQITNNAGSVNVLFSNDDQSVPFVDHEVFPAGWNVRRVGSFGHSKAKEIPVILETILAYKNSGWVPVPDEQLPVLLPDVANYQPTDNGESPLASIESFVNTKCPTCRGDAKRETDTMPNWAGSSWYFLRYIDPNNDQAFADPAKLKHWLPIDLYNGGMEHTTLHLLYSRFWNKFLFDQGLVPCSEPYARRHSHGLIMSEDGTKMSKSVGNVINPDDIVAEYGADTLRVYEVFMGPFEEPVPWSTNGVVGVRRFLDRVTKLPGLISEVESADVTKALHKTIKKVSEDITNFRFNTAVAAMMTFVNTVFEQGSITSSSLTSFIALLCPFAPHVANEVSEALGNSGFVEAGNWPTFDPALIVDSEVTIAIQVNGKLRSSLTVALDLDEASLVAQSQADPNVAKFLISPIKKTIVVPNKIVNFVI